MQRCVSLLVVLAYTAFHAVPVLHAHGGMTTVHSGGERHIHTSWSTSDDRHDGHHRHHHDHESDHHSHHGGVNAVAYESDGPEVCGHASEHDADAIYLPSLNASRADTARQTLEKADLATVVAFALAAAVELPLHQPFMERTAVAENATGEHCALFLKLRTLRI